MKENLMIKQSKMKKKKNKWENTRKICTIKDYNYSYKKDQYINMDWMALPTLQ